MSRDHPPTNIHPPTIVHGHLLLLRAIEAMRRGQGPDTPGLADCRTDVLRFHYGFLFTLFSLSFSTPRTGSQLMPDWVPLDSALFCKGF